MEIDESDSDVEDLELKQYINEIYGKSNKYNIIIIIIIILIILLLIIIYFKY